MMTAEERAVDRAVKRSGRNHSDYDITEIRTAPQLELLANRDTGNKNGISQ